MRFSREPLADAHSRKRLPGKEGRGRSAAQAGGCVEAGIGEAAMRRAAEASCRDGVPTGAMTGAAVGGGGGAIHELAIGLVPAVLSMFH